MTLTTHAVVGAAAAQFFPAYPIVAFSAAFLSHLAIDSLRHYDYKPRSIRKDEANPLNTDMVMGKEFVFDFLQIAADAILGLLLSIFLFHFAITEAPLWLIVLGVIGGILPDPLQFVYFKTRSKLLEPFQRFHVWIQEGKSLEVPASAGLSLQGLLVVVILGVVVIVDSF